MQFLGDVLNRPVGLKKAPERELLIQLVIKAAGMCVCYSFVLWDACAGLYL